MNQTTEPKRESASSLARTALNEGLTALSAASTGAKTGAKLAVGTLFAGCSVLLDLGVQVTRRMPLGDQEEGLQLEAQLQATLIGRPNQIEAVKANLEGRSPEFRDPE